MVYVHKVASISFVLLHLRAVLLPAATHRSDGVRTGSIRKWAGMGPTAVGRASVAGEAALWYLWHVRGVAQPG